MKLHVPFIAKAHILKSQEVLGKSTYGRYVTDYTICNFIFLKDHYRLYSET